MTVQLERPDFQRLVKIVQGLPDFANVRDRHRLVAGALEGEARADTILGGLDLDGAPRGVAVEVIRFLADFGQVVYGKESLGVFLNYIQPFTGDEEADFIASLFERYALDVLASPSRPIVKWRGAETVKDVHERIIGEDTLRHVNMLDHAREAARAVVRVGLADGAGSGFMIAPDLLMTNNHVIDSEEVARTAEYMFNYQLDPDGKACEPLTVGALADGQFYTNDKEELDFTVVQLKDPPDFGQPLRLRAQPAQRDDRVTIIQHPGGHFKKISMQNNFVAYADGKVVQYYTSTMPGSSGSPVFTDDFEVIAIHHSGGMLAEPGSGRRYLRNAGTSMIAVLKDLKADAPDIHRRLRS